MKFTYCYLGEFIDWEVDKDRELRSYKYCNILKKYSDNI